MTTVGLGLNTEIAPENAKTALGGDKE